MPSTHCRTTRLHAGGPSERKERDGTNRQGGPGPGKRLLAAGLWLFIGHAFLWGGCALPAGPRLGELAPIQPALLQEDQKTRLRIPRRSKGVVQPASWTRDVGTESHDLPPAVMVAEVPASARLLPPPTQAGTPPGSAKREKSTGARLSRIAEVGTGSTEPTRSRPEQTRVAARRQPAPAAGRRDAGEFAETPPVFKSISQLGTRIAPPPATEVLEPDADELPGDDLQLPDNPAERFFAQYDEFHYRSSEVAPWGAYVTPSITPSVCHRPLYFEEVNVERFGYSAGILQPAVSAARFFTTVPTLPYRMVVDRPAICQVDPSPHPPGTLAPRHRQLPPLHLQAGLVQAITIVGLIAIFP
jgi:hypothetical protein